MDKIYAEFLIVSKYVDDVRLPGWPSERVEVTDGVYIDENTEIVACDCVSLRKEMAVSMARDGAAAIVQDEDGQLLIAVPDQLMSKE